MRKVSGRLFNEGSARRNTRSSSVTGAVHANGAAHAHGAVNGAVNGPAEPSGEGRAALRTASADSASLGAGVSEAGYRATAALLQVCCCNVT